MKSLSVGVLIDLERSPSAGGHVKCWEKLAEAAADRDFDLDLTLYFLGQKAEIIELSRHVRYHLLTPALGTHRFPWLEQGGGTTDLAYYHRALARVALNHHLLHATLPFALGQTARRIARRRQLGFTCSLHTNLHALTHFYTCEILERLLGSTGIALARRPPFKLAERFAERMRKKTISFMTRSDHLFISSPSNSAFARKILPQEQISLMRRGIDKQHFNPCHRDPGRLRRYFRIPPHDTVILFVGRIDASKEIMILAQAIYHLLQAGHVLHLLAIGMGKQMEEVRRLLGPAATLPGTIPQDDLGWIYASCDLFALPSRSEVAPNVVLEAKSSGLPVLVTDEHSGAHFIEKSGKDGVIVGNLETESWVSALQPLLNDPVSRARLAYEARSWTETKAPDWGQVLCDDLLPIWSQHAHPHKIKSL